MKKKYAFYITNHGFGHASRNVPIIEGILEAEPESVIYIKTDSIRVEFLHRNLKKYDNNILYNSGYEDVGLLLKPGGFEVDESILREEVRTYEQKWEEYIERECKFFAEKRIDVVISDIIPWVLMAAKKSKIPSVLLCNFTWYEMYRDFLPDELCEPYLDAYRCAGKIFLYEFGSKKIEHYADNVERISMISRKINPLNVELIRKSYQRPIIFVSVGRSVEMQEKYNVENVSGTFLVTKGVHFIGDNVIDLPEDLICTQDYICASDYVIIKSGWSSMAEVFLNRKRSAVIARGDNSEDNIAMKLVREKKCAVEIKFEDLSNIDMVLKRIDDIEMKALEKYKDDCNIVIQYILEI